MRVDIDAMVFLDHTSSFLFTIFHFAFVQGWWLGLCCTSSLFSLTFGICLGFLVAFFRPCCIPPFSLLPSILHGLGMPLHILFGTFARLVFHGSFPCLVLGLSFVPPLLEMFLGFHSCLQSTHQARSMPSLGREYWRSQGVRGLREVCIKRHEARSDLLKA